MCLYITHYYYYYCYYLGTCGLHFDDPNDLRKFRLIITPDEGYWHGGRFVFEIKVPIDYNNKVKIQPL